MVLSQLSSSHGYGVGYLNMDLKKCGYQNSWVIDSQLCSYLKKPVELAYAQKISMY